MIVLTIPRILFFSRHRLMLIQFSIRFDAIDVDLQFIPYFCTMIWTISRFFFPADTTDWFWSNFSIRFDANRCIILNQDSFSHSFIHAQFILSQLLFLNLYLLFHPTTIILRWKEIGNRKFPFFLFRLVEMFEICSRTSVMATTYCHCSKCSRAKYWYVLFSPVSWHFDDFFNKILKISFSQSN